MEATARSATQCVDAQALLRQADASLRSGDAPAAERGCRTVLATQPDHPVALRMMAKIALGERMYGLAFRCAARALQVAGDDARTCNVVGGVLFELGRYEVAGAAFREAIRLDPDLDDAVENYALVLQTMNRREEAAELFGALVAKHPKNARLWQLYSVSREFPAGAPEARQLRKLLASARAMAPAARAQLQFALAKMLEDAGDARGAFRACEAGNRLRLEVEREQATRYRDGSLARYAASLMRVFDADTVAQWAGRVPARRGLTLLLGPPRAGKSLLEGPLASHPAVRPWGEIDVILEVLRRGEGEFARAYPDSVRSLSDADALRLAGKLDAAWGEAPAEGVATHVLTMPSNLFHAGTIALLNPETRIVICERDPLDVAMSIYLRYFPKSQPYAWDVDTIAEYVTVYRRLAGHWQTVFPERTLIVRYDELLADPDPTVARVLELHGLPWHDDCADDRAHRVEPAAVGLAGSSAARSRMNADFSRISDFYGEWVPRFEEALERAKQRLAAVLPWPEA